jgi:hypothetical protein
MAFPLLEICKTAALDGARDEPGAQAVCPEARHIKPEAPRTRLHDDSHGLSCRAAAAEIEEAVSIPAIANINVYTNYVSESLK